MKTPLSSETGVSLKPCYYADFFNHPRPGWVEVHAENYMAEGGASHRWLEKIRAEVPLSIHGVGLSLGSAEPLDRDHLKSLVALQKRYQPELFSEHLAWSMHQGEFLSDLLPLPYTDESLTVVCDHVDEMQQALGRQVLLENPSLYVSLPSSEWTEAMFLQEVAVRTGCGLLLDINNVYVSASNLGFTAESYLDDFPLTHVGEIHLAGHTVEDCGTFQLLIDTHDGVVCDEVWSLFRRVMEMAGPKPVCVEWDSQLPSWTVLLSQAVMASERMPSWKV